MLISISRIYLGMHSGADIVGGFFLGSPRAVAFDERQRARAQRSSSAWPGSTLTAKSTLSSGIVRRSRRRRARRVLTPAADPIGCALALLACGVWLYPRRSAHNPSHRDACIALGASARSSTSLRDRSDCRSAASRPGVAAGFIVGERGERPSGLLT